MLVIETVIGWIKNMPVLFILSLFIQSLCTESELPIIPRPVSAKKNPGVFLFHEKVVQYVPTSDPRAMYPAQFLSELFNKSCGFTMEISKYTTLPTETASSCIVYEFSPSVTEDEGYILTITPVKIHIQAKTPKGMFHAVTSIRQLLPKEIEVSKGINTAVVPITCLSITDYPRYVYRGLMLDTGRHFSTVEEVKQYIDFLSLHKMSVFHFHLTEDQGWRIEIKKYPKLTEIGAWRKSRANARVNDDDTSGFVSLDDDDDDVCDDLEANCEPDPNDTKDGMYGGFYTQDQIREIAQFAESRCMRIQPEIELPGHAVAAIASYPELSCTGKQVSVITSWGIFSPVFCSKELTMQFLEDVLTEVMDLFPNSPMIHVGGDECPSSDWSRCDACKQRMKDEGLTNVGQLHGYFMKRVEAHTGARGVRLIGWDEILGGGKLADTTAVMVWHSGSSANQAITKGHDVVLTPMSCCYFDFAESTSAADAAYLSSSRRNTDPSVMSLRTVDELLEDSSIPASTRKLLRNSEHRLHNPALQSPKERAESNGNLQSVYQFDPLSNVFGSNLGSISEDKKKHVLGGQGNLWTERLPTQQRRFFNTNPRLAGLSEALWTPTASKDFEDFRQRLGNYLAPRYSAMHIDYNPKSVPKTMDN